MINDRELNQLGIISISVVKEKKQNKTQIEVWDVINKDHHLFHICFGVIKLILIIDTDIEPYKVILESQNQHRTNYQKIREIIL